MMPLHLLAIRRKAGKHTALASKIDQAVSNPLAHEDLLTTLRIVFDAGRSFQKLNPNKPMTGKAYLA